MSFGQKILFTAKTKKIGE